MNTRESGDRNLHLLFLCAHTLPSPVCLGFIRLCVLFVVRLIANEYKKRNNQNFSCSDFVCFFVKMEGISKGSDLWKEKQGSPCIQESKILAKLFKRPPALCLSSFILSARAGCMTWRAAWIACAVRMRTNNGCKSWKKHCNLNSSQISLNFIHLFARLVISIFNLSSLFVRPDVFYRV